MLVLNPDDHQQGKTPELKFRLLEESFAICRLPAADPIPGWASKGIFTSITRTADELSIVCPAENVPELHKPGIPWVCLKIEGPFAFTEVGILQAFITPLVESNIPIFTISTFDTDYVFVQSTFVELAFHALQGAGHQIISNDQS